MGVYRLWETRGHIQYEAGVGRGRVRYIVWTAETADNVYEFGTDTFVIRDGKILAQSFAGTIRPKQ